jgi:hypothetical protein
MLFILLLLDLFNKNILFKIYFNYMSRVKKMNILFICSFWATINVVAQTDFAIIPTENVLRVNFINPGVEYEMAIGGQRSLSLNLGVGYGGSYPELDVGGNSGFIYIIAPFADLQFKQYYNRNKRLEKSRSIEYNSGNFVSARLLARGASIADNVTRTDNKDFAIGPTWGFQRAYGKVHLLFDIGPYYYWDTKGNSGFFPLIFQLNIGLNLSKR